MPTIIEKRDYTDERSPTRLRWTRGLCRTLIDADLIKGRYELIEGEVISKMGQKPSHMRVIMLLTKWISRVFDLDEVLFQLPVQMIGADAETSEPEPDAVLLSCPIDQIEGGAPKSSDVRTLIEAADSSLSFDRNTKAALYARNGIPEYWVIDVSGRQIYVHRKPTDKGYSDIKVYAEYEQVATLAKPEAAITVSELLPPVS